MKLSIASHPSYRRFRSGFVWLGLVVSCITFCSRGLFAENTPRIKGGNTGRVTSNSSATNSVEKARGSRPAPSGQRTTAEPAATDKEADADNSIFPAGIQPEQLVAPGQLGSTINLVAVMTILSLAPSILIMTTCFIRFIIVTSLLRQALGTQQMPPNNVLAALCLFLTFLVMSPVWRQSYQEGIRPYTHPESESGTPSLSETFDKTVRPIRQFMFEQIENAHNEESLFLFYDYQVRYSGESDRTARSSAPRYQDVALPTLASAYMMSELKVAFIIGFQIFLPFLVIDMVVSTLLTSMGMMMLPPTLVSFPFKLLLFVLIDGWALTVGMLLESVRPGG